MDYAAGAADGQMHGRRGRTDEQVERKWLARLPDHRPVRRAAHHGVAIPHAQGRLDGDTPNASRMDRKIVVKRIGVERPVQTAKPAEIRAAFRERIQAPRRDLARCTGQSGNERNGGDPGDLRQRNAPSLSAGTGDAGTIDANGSLRQLMRGLPRAPMDSLCGNARAEPSGPTGPIRAPACAGMLPSRAVRLACRNSPILPRRASGLGWPSVATRDRLE
jgi:hypothetical protein